MPLPRKILTIDGGGVKGIFPAAFLATVEQCFERPLWECFDLIAGTSTGGIIALALGLGISATEIKELYMRLGPEVFSPQNRHSLWQQLRKAKYNPKTLRDLLVKTFGQNTLGASKTRLVIPAVHALNNQVYVFKTRHHRRFEVDHRVPMVDVAMATAAAPIYFPPHVTANGQRLVDGGVWANNPLGMAAVEAMAVLDWPRDKIVALSLGCSRYPSDSDYPGFGSPLKLKNYVVDLFMQGQNHFSMGTASLILGHERIIRVDPVVPNGRYSLDSCERLEELQALAHAEAREALPKLRRLTFDQATEPFIPYPPPGSEGIPLDSQGAQRQAGQSGQP